MSKELNKPVLSRLPKKHGWFARFKPKRFQYLLFILVLAITVTPLVDKAPIGRTLAAIVSTLAFVQTCISIAPKKRIMIIGGALAFIVALYASAVLTIDIYPLNQQICQMSSRVLAITFYLLAGRLIFLDVISEGPVDLNKLCGSVCIYLLIGVVWGQFFQLADLVDPGCFLMDLSKLAKHGDITPFEQANLLNYFSYVTLTTLGYGDIQPVSRLTRVLAYTEALIAQIYLAILVSRLVGLHIAAAAANNVSNADD